MAEVKWIKLKVGMFDGMSFKKIKKAKIGGESFRDKLTAVWFELMDFAGKCNHDGAFISPKEIPFTDLADIAMMIDREEEELKLCMNFFINEGMVSVVDDIYMLSAWMECQNVDGLEKIKEQNRIRQKEWYDRQKAIAKPNVRSNVRPNVSITQPNALDIDKEKELELDNKSVCDKRKRFSPPTLDDVTAYCQERNNGVDPQRFIDYYTANGWKVGKNPMKDWKATVRTWERNNTQTTAQKDRSYDVDDFFAAACARSFDNL